jgi:hypothetical protein
MFKTNNFSPKISVERNESVIFLLAPLAPFLSGPEYGSGFDTLNSSFNQYLGVSSLFQTQTNTL